MPQEGCDYTTENGFNIDSILRVAGITPPRAGVWIWLWIFRVVKYLITANCQLFVGRTQHNNREQQHQQCDHPRHSNSYFRV